MRITRWMTALAGATLLALGSLTTAAPPAAPGAATKPTVYLIGDSTVRNGSLDNGATAGQWGWGHMLHYYFDESKINIVNDAMGGTSSKSFQTSPTLWALVIPKVKKGDYVIMQFGHNDGPSTLKGNGEETGNVGRGGESHSFGWYMRQYIIQTREKGATPIVCSLIPRNRWSDDGKVNRNTNDYALWAKQAAEQEHALFIPLNDLVADQYDKLGKDKVQSELFPPNEAVHPNWAGARLNAETVVAAIKNLDCPLKTFLKADGKAPDEPDLHPPAHGELGPEGEAVLTRRRGGPPRGGAAPSATAPAAAR